MISNISSWRIGLVSVAAISLAACGGETAPAAVGAGREAGASQSLPADGAGLDGPAIAGAPVGQTGGGLLPLPSWMPTDWDRNALQLNDFNLDPENRRVRENDMMLASPFAIWAMANDTTKDENYQPVWVWWTALRSCERAIQLVDDLSGEFGDRARGAATLTAARNELKAFAATQPADMTLSYMTNLGQWNEKTGDFALTGLVNASSFDPIEVQKVMQDNYAAGAQVMYYSDSEGQYLAGFDAGGGTIECLSPDKQKIHKFWREARYAVRFGVVDRGMGGLPLYQQYERLPDFDMTREQAAAFAQRNPERKVIVSVKFGPAGSAFVEGIDHSSVRGKLINVTIKDALDGSVLATKTY